MKFVDVKNDVAFRKIFGNENKKIILISFLNAVLGLEGQDRVKEVTLLNPFQLPRIIGEKASIIDVRATDKRGVTFIVEMQVAERAGFDKRVLYYTCKDYAGQIKVGDDYPALRPVYFIGILDFNFFAGKNYLSKHLIIDEETGECVFKDMQFRFIELHKFNKNADGLDSIIDQWTFFIKNADELEVIPENVEDEGLAAAYTEAAQHNWTKEAYDAYIYAGMRAQDERGIVELAERRAEEKGEKNSKLQIAREMKIEGEPKEKIIKYTGLTEEEIDEL